MHHQAPHGDSETSHALVQKEEPDPYQDGEGDLPTIGPYPILKPQHNLLGLLRYRQVGDQRNLDDRKHQEGEHDKCAELSADLGLPMP